MSLILSADDHRGWSVRAAKVHFTLLAAKADCVPDAQRDKSAALLTYRIRRRGRRQEPRLANNFQPKASEVITEASGVM